MWRIAARQRPRQARGAGRRRATVARDRGEILLAECALVRVRPGKQAALRAGRPWVYRGEIETIRGEARTGGVVRVEDAHGTFVALGFYHQTSVLAVRILTNRPDTSIDAQFFYRRLASAWDLRKRMVDDPSVCRIVFAEADGLPGLIADRLDDVIVVSTLVAGMDARLGEIVDALAELTGVRCFFERNDGPVRGLEGLPERIGPLRGDPSDRVEIREGAVSLRVDLRHGQKTGHFLDQRDNRQAFGAAVRRLLPLAPGRVVRILDAFCHTGGFGLQAMAAVAALGAPTEAVFLDAAETAVRDALDNAERNGFGGARGVRGNAFDVLRQYERSDQHFAAVVLDPPAFARGRATLNGAYRGYKEINLRAMRMLEPGGVLCTCSCSQPVDETMFRDMLRDAAADAGRRMRVLARRGAPPDHPGLLGADETQYLKCWILQAME